MKPIDKIYIIWCLKPIGLISSLKEPYDYHGMAAISDDHESLSKRPSRWWFLLHVCHEYIEGAEGEYSVFVRVH